MEDLKIGDRVLIVKNDKNSRRWNSGGSMDHWIGTEQIIFDTGSWVQEPRYYFLNGGSIEGKRSPKDINYWTWTRDMLQYIPKVKPIKKLKLKFNT